MILRLISSITAMLMPTVLNASQNIVFMSAAGEVYQFHFQSNGFEKIGRLPVERKHWGNTYFKSAGNTSFLLNVRNGEDLYSVRSILNPTGDFVDLYSIDGRFPSILSDSVIYFRQGAGGMALIRKDVIDDSDVVINYGPFLPSNVISNGCDSVLFYDQFKGIHYRYSLKDGLQKSTLPMGVIPVSFYKDELMLCLDRKRSGSFIYDAAGNLVKKLIFFEGFESPTIYWENGNFLIINLVEVRGLILRRERRSLWLVDLDGYQKIKIYNGTVNSDQITLWNGHP